MAKQLSIARTIAASMFLFCIGCSPDEPAIFEPNAAAIPEPDQVTFYERPLTLAAARKSVLPSPVLILLEKDPWAMVIGSDSPAFALYEDGTVIHRTATGFGSVKLTREERDRFLERLDFDALSKMYGAYQATDWTDQPEQDLLIYRGEKPTFISIYGSLKKGEVRSSLPSEIVTAYDTVIAFRHSGAQTWLPENVEVMIWPYEHAPDASIIWPKAWPDLNDKKTIGRGDSFSVFLPSTRLTELRAFLKRRNDKGAVEINGRKWAASVRFPFPHEGLWMAPNPELKPPLVNSAMGRRRTLTQPAQATSAFRFINIKSGRSATDISRPRPSR